MIIKTIIFLISITTAFSASLHKNAEDTDGRVLYDQRQEGEWNVRADLKNFVILIIPTQSSTSSPATGGLLDFFAKAVPKKHSKKSHHHPKNDAGEETMHFIESKTAPYHVDISRTRSHLSKLHPSPPVPVVKAEEIVIAHSPTIALVKDEEHNRGARAFVLTVPSDEEYMISKTEEHKKPAKMEVKKKESMKSTLKLLGAEYEQCGPGLFRDADGICRVSKN